MTAERIVGPSLDKVRSDLEDTKEALAAYWSHGLSDTDYKIADIHTAAEALMRAVSSLTLAVERLARLAELPS